MTDDLAVKAGREAAAKNFYGDPWHSDDVRAGNQDGTIKVQAAIAGARQMQAMMSGALETEALRDLLRRADNFDGYTNTPLNPMHLVYELSTALRAALLRAKIAE